MRGIFINEYEQIVSDDLNNLQLALHKSLCDDTLYNFFGQVNGVLGSGLIVSMNSSSQVAIGPGVGFFYDGTQTNFNPKYRMINNANSQNQNIATPDATHNRIDLIWAMPEYDTNTYLDRYIKTGGVGPVTLTNVPKYQSSGMTFGVTAGTPSASPVVPSTPAGAIALAQVLVHAVSGITGGGDITDVRNILTLAVSNNGHTLLTATSLQGQLDQIDAYLRGSGNSVKSKSSTYQILVTDKLIKVSGTFTITLPDATTCSGLELFLKKTDSNAATVTINTLSAQTIDGASSITLVEQYSFYKLISDGSNWLIVGAG